MRPRELTVEGFRSYRAADHVRLARPPAGRHRGPDRRGEVLDPGRDLVRAVRQDAGRRARHEVADPPALRPSATSSSRSRSTDRCGGRCGRSKRKGQAGHQLELLADGRARRRGPGDGHGRAGRERTRRAAAGHGLQGVLPIGAARAEPVQRVPEGHAGDRDKVLKGVFGYERLDAAQARREAPARPGRRWRSRRSAASATGIDEARDAARGGRGAPSRRRPPAARRSRPLRPEVEELLAKEAAAAADADVGRRAGSTSWLGVADAVPPGEQVDRRARRRRRGRGQRRADARRPLEQARASPRARRRRRSSTCASASAIASSFRIVRATRCEQLDEARAARSPRPPTPQAQRRTAARRDAGARRATPAESTEARNRSRRADDAWRKRPPRPRRRTTPSPPRDTRRWPTSCVRRCVAGEPCPVCDQPVATLPKARCRAEGGRGRREGARQGRARRGRPARREGTARHHRRRGRRRR